MRAFRTKVTLLIMTALILISVLSITASVVVARSGSDSGPRFAYRVTDGTVSTMIAAPTPFVPDALALMSYAILIAAASATVAILVANMVIRPLETLQRAIDSVNPQAIIPQMAESGDGSGLIAVRLLNKLSDTLKGAMNSRMRLVAAAGHDLRTPLTRMRLRAELLEDGQDKSKWISDIDEMLHIADSAITLVKEEITTDNCQRLRLDQLVGDLVAELEMVGHAVAIGRLEPVEIVCGPHAVKRAISNLLVNACTHGKDPRISLSRDESSAVVEIVDDGPGIPEEMIENAFEPFFRAAAARNRAVSGAGLGLAIVKEIVTRHGGTISLSNRSPAGLYQEVLLPLAPEGTESAPIHG